MRKVLVLAATVACAAVASSVALAGQPARHGGSFTLHVTLPTSAQLFNPPLTSAGPPPGELLLLGGTGSFTGKGGGTVYYKVAAVSTDTAMVDAVLKFKSGTITASGLTTEQTGDPESYAITGGTGRYAGARGEIVQSNDTANDTQETFDLTFSFTGRHGR